MSNSMYNLIVTNDSRIQDIGTKVDVAVRKGPSSSSYQRYPASSKSTSSINFTVPINSERTIIDRNINIRCIQELEVVCTGVEVGVLSLSMGQSESLQAFPFNSLITNAQVNINNSTHTVNTQDLMAILLKTCDNELLEHNAPYLVDGSFKSYAHGVLESANPLANKQNLKKSIPGRGSHPLINWTCTRVKANNDTNVASKASYEAGNDAVKATQVGYMTSTATTDVFTWVLKFETTEPLLFNPVLNYAKEGLNSAGMYGIGQMLINLNLDSTAKRSFSSASAHSVVTRLKDIELAELNINFLTPQPSSTLSNVQVLPFIEHTRVLTTNQDTVLADQQVSIVNSSIQLNQIPDMFYICVRKNINSQTCKDSNSFWPITKCSVNFNNIDNIFSGANINDLYKMSSKNGVQQSQYEWQGKVQAPDGLSSVYTAGSILALSPQDMNLPDFLAPGSIGQFTFQINITALNSEGVDTRPELLIITKNSGLLKTENGMTTTTSGLLTQEMVTNATMSQFGESENYVKGYSKGSNSNASMTSSLKNVPLLNMSKSGGAHSGGAHSGGAHSGGARSGGSMASALSSLTF